MVERRSIAAHDSWVLQPTICSDSGSDKMIKTLDNLTDGVHIELTKDAEHAACGSVVRFMYQCERHFKIRLSRRLYADAKKLHAESRFPNPTMTLRHHLLMAITHTNEIEQFL